MMGPVVDLEERELEEALLRTGRNVRMTPELRAKTFAALGIGVAVGVTTTATAKASTLGWFSGKTGAVAAGLVGAAGVAGAVALSGGFAAEQPPVEEQGAVATALQGSKEARSEEVSDTEGNEVSTDVGEDVPIEAAPLRPGELQEVSPQEADTVDEPSRVEVQRTKQRSSASPTRAEPSGLREELSHIARVEAALSSGDPGRALALLSEYRRRFNPPKLGLEAEVLTIQALSEKGSVAAARQRAARFVEKYPTSPLGARARRYLE